MRSMGSEDRLPGSRWRLGEDTTAMISTSSPWIEFSSLSEMSEPSGTLKIYSEVALSPPTLELMRQW